MSMAASPSHDLPLALRTSSVTDYAAVTQNDQDLAVAVDAKTIEHGFAGQWHGPQRFAVLAIECRQFPRRQRVLFRGDRLGGTKALAAKAVALNSGCNIPQDNMSSGLVAGAEPLGGCCAYLTGTIWPCARAIISSRYVASFEASQPDN